MPEGAKKWLEELLQSKRKQAIAKHDCSQFKITKAEVAAYAVSLVVLTLAFSYVKVPDVSLIYTVLPMVLFTAVVVEVVKTYVLEVYARSKGLWTEHRIWYLGLALFLVTTLSFGVPFSSPTRNIYHSGNLTKKLEGMMGAVAVLVTLAFAGLFFVLLLAGFSIVGGTGLAMCAILGLVDVFPVEPLYGKAVYGFSRGLWVGLFGACVAVYAAWLLFL
jgi:hypothetical protein